MRPRYPLGEQNFEKIREEGFVYIDKTSYIPLLLRNNYYFLSRPRRFGKSLFLSTLEHFFLGHKDLFAGLAVERMDWDWETYPVLRIDFTGENYRERTTLEGKIRYILEGYEKEFGIEKYESMSLSLKFDNLIKQVSQNTGKRVVVLVDEYEKALLDVIEDRAALDVYRNLLSGFYSVLKAQTDHIKFVFLTGVTRFGHLNIFSGLNNITDISLDPRYQGICGISEEEISENLMSGVREFAVSNELTEEEALGKLKEYYDGYHFSKEMKDMYNPYSLMSALEKGDVDDMWMSSGNSTYLLKVIRNADFNLMDLEGVKVGIETLRGIDPEMDEPVSLLYQGGYLTIKGYEDRSGYYELGLPNKEVKTALYKSLVPYYLGSKRGITPKEYSVFINLRDMRSDLRRRGDK